MCECCSKEKDIYLPKPATINKTRIMNGTELYMQISMDNEPLAYEPGQFVEVSLAGVGEVPISISSSPTQKDGFELVIRRIGNVTGKIHTLSAGGKVGIRGPYGEGCYPAEETRGRNLVFICGGIGLVPQRSFINYALDNRADYGSINVLLGTKSAGQRFFHSELSDWTERDDINFYETMDQAENGWQGNVGVVTTLIPRIKAELSDTCVFVCGPPIMYKFVLMSLAENKVPKERIYLNLERKMKCGVGKCGHCQMNDRYVCVDGPVFRYCDLDSVPEAI